RLAAWWHALVRLAGFTLVGTAILVTPHQPAPQDGRLQQQVQQLSAEIQQLKQEQTMPSMVLTRYRNSICYIYGVYNVGRPGHRPGLRARLSGTGFMVGDGLAATNRSEERRVGNECQSR